MSPNKPPVAWIVSNATGRGRWLRFSPPAWAVDPEPTPLCLDRDRQVLWEALYRIRTHALQAQVSPGFAKDQCWEIMQIAEQALGGQQ
jgi:hypothetical protein